MFSSTFYFKTEMNEKKSDVWSFFQTNENLVAITGFPKIKLLGDKEVKEGADVILQMNFFVIKLLWKGEITKVVPEDYFMDEGVKLPFPFRTWQHVHAFKELEQGGTRMIDRVEFSSYIPAIFIKLMLFGMFQDRKRQLKKIFKDVK